MDWSEKSRVAGKYRNLSKSVKEKCRYLRDNSTLAEEVLWEIIRDKRIAGNKFRRQHSIGPYIVDFYCHAAGLIVEVDGPIHIARQAEDAERTDWLSSAGLKVIRFSNNEVIDSPGLVKQRIENELTARMRGAS